jgi:two-component system, sensor histidine kinase and response regulator
MNGIMGMTELALDTELKPEQREYLQLVKTSTDSLLQIMNEILDYSMIEAGNIELEVAPMAVQEVVSDVLRSLSARANEKGLELVYRVAPDVPDWLLGDAQRLQQVMMNLVTNAIKFTDGGEVAVNIKAESMNGDTVRLHFAIRDTGIGIPPHQQDLIFDAFSQGDGSLTRRFGGTGLGLAISKRLVALMGGRIWVQSEVGKGSTFHFTAGFRRAPEDATTVSRFPVRLADVRVLIVEDNASNRLILEELTTRWQMRVSSVDRGATALAILQEAAAANDPFAVVLLDVMMPELDGFAVAEQIAQRAELTDIKVILLSSLEGKDSLARCESLGVAKYLLKPVSASDLNDALTAVLGGSRGAIGTESLEFPTAEDEDHCWQVLLVEDNIINQRVASALLEKYGHCVVVANNGNEALEALACQQFDIVLMDVQMPLMDGIQATAAIREKEQATGKHIPIIAMTAHAMKGDRERFLLAGMDAYISKPVNIKELFQIVQRLAPPTKIGKSEARQIRKREEPASPETRALSGDAEVLDLTALRARLEQDLDLLEEMIELFLETSPQLFSEVAGAVANGNGPQLASSAHTLKGVLQNMCAERCARLALRLETCGRTGDMELAEASWNELQSEWERLQTALEQTALEISP